MKLILLLLIFLSQAALSLTNEDTHISFGEQIIGDSRLEFNLQKDFIIEADTPSPATIKLIENTLQWVRVKDVLLVPRALIEVSIANKNKNLSLKYQGTVIASQNSNVTSLSSFYVSLFAQDKVYIYEEDLEIGSITIKPNPKHKKKKTVLIDYSCSQYNVDISGLQKDFLTVGCKMNRTGSIGDETPFLEVIWMSASHKLQSEFDGAYVSTFRKSSVLKQAILNSYTSETNELTISAKLPKKLHRFKSAIGAGPYILESTFDSITEKELSPSLALYFNFELNKTNSMRGFNLYVHNLSHGSVFNNGGLYYANDIASALDGRLVFTTLLGIQGMHFRFNENEDKFQDYIAPQGIEIMWKHAFNKTNHVLDFGIFFDSSSSYDYVNTWLRYNRLEINYLSWEQDNHKATTWGLSYLFPFKQLF